jgi:hypothetical protein
MYSNPAPTRPAGRGRLTSASAGNVGIWHDRPFVDTSVILYTAEIQAPALRAMARRVLAAEAARLGVPLDPAGVLLRRAAGDTEMHLLAAASALVDRLVETEADPLADDSLLLVLAHAGELALMSRIEIDESRRGAGETPARPSRLPCSWSGLAMRLPCVFAEGVSGSAAERPMAGQPGGRSHG